MNNNIKKLKKIIKEEVQKALVESDLDPKINLYDTVPTSDLDRAFDALDKLREVIETFEKDFNTHITELENNIELTLEDMLSETNGILSEGDFIKNIKDDLNIIEQELFIMEDRQNQQP